MFQAVQSALSAQKGTGSAKTQPLHWWGFAGGCMGPELVHKAIEVMWGEDGLWYAGYVAAFRYGRS